MKFTGERFLFGGSSNRTKIDSLVKYIFASFFTRNKRILDIACGSGFGSFMLAQEASQVTGVDISAESINYAQGCFVAPNLKYRVGDAVSVQLPLKYFDCIVSFQTIEHLDSPGDFLDNLSQVLKDDGLIVLATPNKKIVSPFTTEPIGKFHKFEFYKRDLDKMFTHKFNAKWFGQRSTFKPFANYFVRRGLRVFEIMFNKKFGFYGARESYEIVPLTFWREPKDFIILLTKKNK